MNADRLFFPAVLAACAALALLSAAEPARVAQARADAQVAATPVVQLERVVITASRAEAGHTVASADTAADAGRTVR